MVSVVILLSIVSPECRVKCRCEAELRDAEAEMRDKAAKGLLPPIFYTTDQVC